LKILAKACLGPLKNFNSAVMVTLLKGRDDVQSCIAGPVVTDPKRPIGMGLILKALELLGYEFSAVVSAHQDRNMRKV
jgi:hypothetical protein